MRIVSLIASSTEIACALGAVDELVARSHECDFPAAVTRLPAITAPKFDTDGSSAQIDERVKELLRSALSVYRVDADALAALAPDVILTQSQCEVCAVSLKDVEAAACALLPSRPRIVSLETNALDDLWRDLRKVAQALGREAQGEALVASLQARIAAIADTARVIDGARPTVACIEWIEPLMAAGNWMPELVALAGGTNLFGAAGRHSPFMTWDELVARDPDVIVTMPCGFDIARTRAELPTLTRRDEWPHLAAVRAGRVFVTDGNQYFNRPGPRLVESLEILAEILHPERFSFGHEGSGWQRVSAS
jgi:iron complex transport system substrate-binding protein